MNCYTYYDKVDGLDESGMLELWSDSWRKHGWNPVVLSQSDAEKSVFFHAYHGAVNKLPTMNPKDYEMACYLRWLAMSMTKGGMMTDFDVINYGFTPMDIHMFERLTFYTPNVPCAVSGTPVGFRAASLLIGGTDAKEFPEHCSDMYILEKYNFCFRQEEICKQYRDTGWETAPLVHFSSSSCPRPKRDKIIAARDPR